MFGFSSNSTGVFGQSNSWNGVQGFSNTGIGIYGESIELPGVWGISHNLMGVFGFTESQNQFAVLGQNSNTPDHFGALGGVVLPSGFGIGVYGAAPDNSPEWAGLFEGNVNIVGNCWITEDLLVGGSKFFQIDHPSDPENKYLIHSCVESPERMNIYNGNVVIDGSGLVTVELPGYFDALNIDYRYQLTVIGQFAQAIIESKIQNNRFTIKTDKPNIEVSWQVTGVRNDLYAKTHPLIAEKEKSETERGKYLNPEIFGKPKEMGIHYVKIELPEMKQQLKPEFYKYEKPKEMKNENE